MQNGILECHPGQQRALHAGWKLSDAGKGDAVFEDILIRLDLALALHQLGERVEHGHGLATEELEALQAEVHHVNPTCGDEITLRVHLDGNTVSDISYAAQGCSISQASTSVLNDLIVGKNVEEGMAGSPPTSACH